MSFELISLAGPLPTVILVTVYDKNDVSLGVFTVDYQGGKVFLGILVGPGQTIGRVDIWDQSDGAEGISNFALYLQQEQLPWCPWDCAIPHDKVINVIDFLALLAGWGQPGPCDFDGGGVSVTDFLKLLAVWGPCPTPVNDECVDKIVLDRFDPAGQIIEHFDMYGATPSPEPLQCFPVPNDWKDIWYCLVNTSSSKKLVTLSGSVDLFAEVTSGCVCPPGPLLACGRLVLGNTIFELQPGEQACIRLLNDLNLPNDGIKGDLIITNEPIQVEPVNFYTDPGQFFQAIQEAGKFSKFFWDFKPFWDDGDNIPEHFSPLDIFSHTIPPQLQDPWTDPAGIDLWPPEVDNVQFVANLNPQGPLAIPTDLSLAFVKGGFPPFLLDNNALVDNFFDRSFGIISGPPAGDNHTAFWFEVISIAGPLPTVIHVTVYDKNDVEIGKLPLSYAVPNSKIFVGVLTKDPSVTIGRIDIWDVNNGAEGISAIEAFLQQPQPICDVPFICGGPIEVCIPGTDCICLQTPAGDVFCGDVSSGDCNVIGPCPNGDLDCPPGSRCAAQTCCGEPICLPVCNESAAPAAPPGEANAILGGASN
jgi:hypothetical protein